MLKPVLLIVDDEQSLLNSLARIFRRADYEIITLSSGMDVLELSRERKIDLMLVDLLMPGMSGIELLNALRREHNSTPIIIMTGYGSIQSAVDAMKAGAVDYIAKPFMPEDIKRIVSQYITRPAGKASEIKGRDVPYSFCGMVGFSEAMQDIYKLIGLIAPTNSTVLVHGETGTGKELVARAIHEKSQRSGKQFMGVNCSAISGSVFESEFFGYVKGAFTGATTNKAGLLKAADGGTLFLDEIGDLPLDHQPKLLRVLQEREMIPVGATNSVKVDIRLVAATNQELEIAVSQGRFRSDLLYRLQVFPILIPPLRERKDDIMPLVHHFLAGINAPENESFILSDEAVNSLMDYHWPGNIRELKNVIERACALARKGLIALTHLPEYFRKSAVRHDLTAAHADSGGEMSNQEYRANIRKALQSSKGNKRKAARLLGISRATLYRKLKLYDM